jgi:hypothetical protein
MSLNIIIMVSTLIGGGVLFLLGLRPWSMRIKSKSDIKDYKYEFSAEDVSFVCEPERGYGTSRNNDHSFSNVIQYQEDTWPVIEKMISKVKLSE